MPLRPSTARRLCRRRCASAPMTSTAFTSALTQRRWMWPATPIRKPRPRRVSACRLRWPPPCCTAACGRRRSAPFTPERLLDARIRALIARIELRIDPQLDAAFPGQRAARVRIVARDARQGQWLQATRKGDPDAPLSDGALNAKFLELTEPVLGAAAAARLRARIWQLEAMPSLRLP